MFIDNGDAVTQAAIAHLNSALELFAKSIETMEPAKLLRISEHMGKGARLGTRVIGGSNDGQPPKAELGLWDEEGGWLEICGITKPPLPTKH